MLLRTCHNGIDPRMSTTTTILSTTTSTADTSIYKSLVPRVCCGLLHCYDLLKLRAIFLIMPRLITLVADDGILILCIHWSMKSPVLSPTIRVKVNRNHVQILVAALNILLLVLNFLL